MVGQAQTQTEALFVDGSVTCEIVTEYDSASCVIMTTTFLFLRKYKGETLDTQDILNQVYGLKLSTQAWLIMLDMRTIHSGGSFEAFCGVLHCMMVLYSY